MHWHTWKSLFMLSLWTSICCVPISLAQYRVIRLSNSSQFLLDPELKNDPMNKSAPSEMDMCTNISNSEQNERIIHSSVLNSTETGEYKNETELIEFDLDCLQSIVEFGCYEIFPNRSVHVPAYQRQFDPMEYHINPDTKELFVCLDYFDDRSKHKETDINEDIKTDIKNCSETGKKNGINTRIKNGTKTGTRKGRKTGIIYGTKTGIINGTKTGIKKGRKTDIKTDISRYRKTVVFETSHTAVLISMAASILCIILYWFKIMILKRFRNLLGCCIFSLSVALLLSYCCTFVIFFKIEEGTCTGTAIVEGLATLVYLFWLNVISYETWRSLKLAVAKQKFRNDRSMCARFSLYSLYAWFVPGVIVPIGMLMDGTSGCWFNYKRQILFGIAVLLLFLNALHFISSVRILNRRSTKRLENKKELWSRFYAIFPLVATLEIEWFLREPLTTFTGVTWLWYVYAPCNVLAGIWILFCSPVAKNTAKNKEK